VVQVRATIRAQAPAVAAADHFHGQRQQHLLSQDIRKKYAFTLKKADFGVIILQPRFFRPLVLGYRAIKQIKRAIHFVYHRFQAPGANQFHFRLDVARNANLPVEQLRGGIHFQRLDCFISPVW
jgi:hypothetical protein